MTDNPHVVELLEILVELLDQQNLRLDRMAAAEEHRNALMEEFLIDVQQQHDDENWWRHGGEPPV